MATRSLWTWPSRQIDLNVGQSELATRRANLKMPEPRYRHGVLAKYARLVTGRGQGRRHRALTELASRRRGSVEGAAAGPSG